MALPGPLQDVVERQAADLGDALGQVLHELGWRRDGTKVTQAGA